MILLDAYAVISYFRGENAAGAVAELLGEPTLISAVNVAEVVDQMLRVFGRDRDEVEAGLAMLEHSGMEIVPLTAKIGLVAGVLRATHYHKQKCAISMADCVAAAAALDIGAALASSDPHLLSVMRVEGGLVHPLPDRKGRVPT